MTLLRFAAAAAGTVFTGGRAYRRWMALLAALAAVGAVAYGRQLEQGLIVTGMSDQVSWGWYIANFAFLVGIAAAAVLLVIPAYVFHRVDAKAVVLVGEGLAVAAVVAAMLFVFVDLGSPERAWHLIPFIGRLHWPASLLAWDVVVLLGYLALNVALPLQLLYARWRGRDGAGRVYFACMLVAIVWAIGIHTVTAFLFSANPGRPYWHSALLGPRFIASAFVSGPALIIAVLHLVRRIDGHAVAQSVIDMLALIMTVALQVSLFFVGAELFTDFYAEGRHAGSARYLWLGLDGLRALQPWIWGALALNLTAVVILSVHRWRRTPALLNAACALAFVGVWVEKGMGLVVPGFIPTPLGEVFEYAPTAIELLVSLGIWACGAMVFTVLARAAIAVQSGRLRAAG